MAFYFASDLHLQKSAVEISRRFASFVDALTAEDQLLLCGDLCDFWFSTQEQHNTKPDEIEGLAALMRFRERGGRVRTILGNHDVHMRDYFVQRVGIEVHPEPLQVECFGYRVSLRHGHLSSPVSKAKEFMATRWFHDTFSMIPGFMARPLHHARLKGNARTETRRNQKLLAAYRQFVREHQTTGEANEIFLFGHVHHLTDECMDGARMIVFTDWSRGKNYLRIDESGVEFVRE